MSIRAFCGLVAAAIILACGLVVLWPLGGLQARAAEPCQPGWMTIAEDKALVAGNPDIQYLGLGQVLAGALGVVVDSGDSRCELIDRKMPRAKREGEPMPITRTLTLREAVNVNDFGRAHGGPGSFLNLLFASHPEDMSLHARTVRHGNSIIQCRHFQKNGDHMLMHVIGYTPDDLIQVVPLAAPQGLQLAEAPADMEFLDGEMMLHVRDDNVLICRCGLPDGAFMAYVEHVALAAGFEPDVSRTVLGKRIDLDKMALIEREGVHRLKLNAVAHSVSVDAVQRETVRKRLAGTVFDELRDLLGLEEEIPEEAENLKVEVSLSFDKRHGTAIDKESLQRLAETVLEQDDNGFSIETMTGRKVRAADILLSKSVVMEPYGKSVHHLEAWQHLAAFDAELRAPNEDG